MGSRAIAAFTLLLPANAYAYEVVVPKAAECLQVREHSVVAEVSPDGGRATSTLVFSAEGTHALLLPEVAGVVPRAELDGAPLALERLEGDAAAALISDLAAQRPTPALIAASGGAVWTATAIVAAGEHTLIAEGGAVADWSSSPAHVIVPLRDLGTACNAPPVHVTLTITSPVPIGTVFTPYHDRSLKKLDARRAVVEAFTQPGAQCHDLHAYVSASKAPVSASLVSYRKAACNGDGDPGYVLLAAGATVLETGEADAKDIVMVIDTSGSMGGEKIEQVRMALASILAKLRPGDRFDLVTFSNDARPLFSGLVDASDAEKVAQARALASSLQAGGGTNIHDALLAGLAEVSAGSGSRPRMLVFLTDGAATAGVTDSPSILADVARANEAAAKIYVFGVGYDVNTGLLDALSRQNGGATQYLRPGMQIDAALDAFYASIQAPVATDLQLAADGVSLRDLYPEKLPDLFVGGDAFVTGRYGDAPHGRVAILGRSAGAMSTYEADGALLQSGTAHAFLPRLWASRRLGQLLYEARQNGGAAETVAEIRAIALRHGFVTPFTPFRVGMDGALDRTYVQPTSEQIGENAVGTSGYINTLSGNSNAAAYGAMEGGGVAPMRQVLDRTFVLDKGTWIDTTAPEVLDDASVIDIAFMGDAWRALAASSPEARELLSVGKTEVFTWRCAVIRVSPTTAQDEALPGDLLGPTEPEVAIPPPAGDLDLADPSCAAAGRGADSSLVLLALLALVMWRRSRSA